MSTARVPVSTADLRQWCTDSRLPGEPPALSDEAALLIASGHCTPAGRALVVRRMSMGLPLPRLAEPYADLRRTQHAITHIERQLTTGAMPNMVAAVLRTRLAGLIRKREDARRTVVVAKGVFPGGTRAIRRERRENVYLELDERERLFGGLLCTPVANLPTGGPARRAGSAAIDRFAGFIGGLAGRGAASSVEEWITEALGGPGSPSPSGRGASFSDGYETLQFIAGHFYDRITGNRAWRSDFFELQRTQVNLHAELAEIAADVVALRSLRVDLDRARATGGFDPDFVAHLDQREAALRPVWTELLQRVQALTEIAQTVESAAEELRLLDEYDRASTLDARIDHLVARSGDRELSADHSLGLAEQVRAGEEQLRIYRDVLQGDLARIAAPAQYQLPERYEP